MGITLLYLCECLLYCVLLFLGKKSFSTPGDGESIEEYFEGVSYKDIEVLGNFKLSTDEARHYCDKLAIISQTRAFPDQAYPSGADPEHQPAAQGMAVSAPVAPAPAGASTSAASGSATAPSSAADSAVKDLHETLIAHHHSVVKLLENAGIKDVCSLYKGTKIDKMLMSLGPKEVYCQICKRDFSSKQHLRDHIKGAHLRKTSHYCAKCKKYFTDASSLKVHTSSHDVKNLKFQCSVCEKKFLSQAKLNEHMPAHGGKTHWCQYCKEKSYKHKKGLVAHESTCKSNDNRIGPFPCRLCGKEYENKRDRKRHMKSAHNDAPAEI